MILLMSFRRNRSLRLRPVHSIKHVVDLQGGLVAGTQLDSDLIEAVDSPTLATTDRVETGSTVNSIFLKCEVYATSTAALANCYMMIWKNPGGNITAPACNAVGADDDKRFVIHQEMVMMEKNTTGNPRTLFHGVIKIPRGYKRFGINDKLQISLLSTGVNADFCFESIYKELR